MSIPSDKRRSNWNRVSFSNPCPICNKPDWCSVSADGRLARCQRIGVGATKTATDKNGQTYYLHRLDGAPRADSAVAAAVPPGPDAERADADTLDRAYQCLLGQLPLSAQHREDLRRRGLTDEAIDRGGYRTLPDTGLGRGRVAREIASRVGAEVVLSVPGIVSRLRRQGGGRYLTIAGAAGLLVPVRDLTGRIVALKIRRDHEGGRYHYLSSGRDGGPGPGSPVHTPRATPATAERVRLTEGELKADVAWSLSGVPTLGVPGVSCWRLALDVLKTMGAKTVRLAWDADATEKPTVARALSEVAEALVAAGIGVEMERWDAAAGKGIDDVLARGGNFELLTGDAARSAIAEALALATADEEPEPPDALDGLADLLAGDDPTALFRNTPILKALGHLAEQDPAEFAYRREKLRQAGIRLRDLDAALKPHRRTLRQEQPIVDSSCPYRISGGCMVKETQTRDGSVEVPLANFSAHIVERTILDDGAEPRTQLAIEGALSDGTPLPRVNVSAESFPRMEWTVPAWGTQAVVYAGAGTRDNLRAALQLISGEVPNRTVYGHLGWREVGGVWHYLHAGGAIGPAGSAANVEVSLPDALVRYRLPDPPTGQELVAAVRASLVLLDAAPGRISYPLLAGVYRSVLGIIDSSLHLCGPTGVGKSELVALNLQHFGAGLDARHLPASWSSTANSIEGMAFVVKDGVLVIDDFAPCGSSADMARLNQVADRLFRAQGNSAGRMRMRADGGLRPARPPRGMIYSTGEDIPRGLSIRARLWVLEVTPGDISLRGLTTCQRDAAEGKYAAAMTGFVHWLAPRYAEVKARLADERAELRCRATTAGQHARTPGIVADLALGLRYLLDFATEVGAIEPERCKQLWERGWQALADAAAAQAEHAAAAEPTGHFLRLLSAALASGRAHLADMDGSEPQGTPGAWGWRSNGGSWEAQGRRIGWLDSGNQQIFLEPDAAYAAAQSFAGEQGESLSVAPRTLLKRLHERGQLAVVDGRGERVRFTVRRTLEGKQRGVICVGVAALLPEDGDPVLDTPLRNGHSEWPLTPPEDPRVASGVAIGSGHFQGASGPNGHSGH